MAQYLSAHMNGGVYNGRRVLSEAGMEALHLGVAPTPYGDSYAAGWFDERWEGERVLNHYGSFTGYHANMMFAPGRDVGLVMLTNAESYLANERRWEIAKNAFRLLLGQELRTPGVSASLVAFWVVILCSLAVLTDFFLFLGRRVRGAEPASSLRGGVLGLALVGAGLGFLFGLPRVFDAPMSSIRLSTPDVGYVFTVAGWLALAWGAARVILSLSTHSRFSAE